MPGIPFSIRPLYTADAPTLSDLLRAQSPDYMRYFTPFAFDIEVIEALLAAARDDVYSGVFWGDALAGFFMLRGWDAGYSVPAYGVTIGEEWRGAGLGRLTLAAARSICALRGATQIMLKVHPDNTAARHLYERFGFVRTGHDAKNGNDVYHLTLASR